MRIEKEAENQENRYEMDARFTVKSVAQKVEAEFRMLCSRTGERTV